MSRITQPITWLNQSFEGYVVVNIEYSGKSRTTLSKCMKVIADHFGDAVACAPLDSLHITLLDWLAPLADYGGQDKATLYSQLSPEYDAALTKILASEGPFTVTFNQIKVSPSTIYIVGQDDGQFARIRNKFLREVDLLPGTKMPSSIVHSSLIRFTQEIDLDKVEEFVATLDITLTHNITTFSLVRATRGPMLDYEVLKEYTLN